MAQDIADFIRANLPLTSPAFTPEISIHKAAPTSGLRRLAEEDDRFGSPYWAYYWGGGLALARYLLDHPQTVRDKRVFDLGTGSGMVAIAAALAGAAEVLASDIDPYALAAAQANAEANGVRLLVRLGDPTGEPPPAAADVVTVGDLFYERRTARRVLRWLRACEAAGVEVLIGDPWRAHLPAGDLAQLAAYSFSEATGAAAPGGPLSSVFRLKPAGAGP